MIGLLLRWVLLPCLALAILVGLFVEGFGAGWTGELHPRGEIAAGRVPAAAVAARVERQKRILFGDLHVHTTYSSDAFVFSLPFIGKGAYPPADACDFARWCSELDFWSINDHAEQLTPRQWRETREAIRECNAAAGEPADPDLVAFLGWEWTQSSAARPSEPQYAHKNVIFVDQEEGRVPTRPIGAGKAGLFVLPEGIPGPAWDLLRVAMAHKDLGSPKPYLDFNRWLEELAATPDCAPGVPVRELPEGCLESAESPALLFEKLDDWGFESLVIPHGATWGIHAPPGADFGAQLEQHDPERQRLFEVYSGHGTGEVFRDIAHVERDGEGRPVCPEPSADFTPCCWRAGELIRERCGDVAPALCEERVQRARRLFVGLPPGQAERIVPGATPEEWLECGQLRDAFLPTFDYRPRMSAQYALAVRRDARAFRFGLIGSSDNHKARAGAGYKEFARKAMADPWGFRDDWNELLARDEERAPEPALRPSLPLPEPDRNQAYYYTGGLVAAHAVGRDRRSIFDALRRREVYATSGDRILLWFDLENGGAGPAPMGAEVVLDEAPRFRVRAVGAFEELPGCPDYTRRSLAPERLARLCLGECHNPGERRKRIERIEVVRIRPQAHPAEPVSELVEDPWRVFPCPSDESGCDVSFRDDGFPGSGREAVYYVRALQEPSLAVNGDPLRCARDASGACVESRPCYASGPKHDPDDDCLAPVRERAWSSPIFLTPGGAER